MIQYDFREKDLKLIDYLYSFLEMEKVSLKYGDFYLEDIDTYIERKSFLDFFSSFIDDRLDKQIVKLLESEKKFYIFIIGSINDLDFYNSKKKKELEDIELMKIQCNIKILSLLKKGIKIHICNNYEDFYRSILFLLNNTENTINNLESTIIKHNNKYISLLASIKGIGLKKAIKLQEKYKNITDLISNIDNLNMSKNLIRNIKESFGLI